MPECCIGRLSCMSKSLYIKTFNPEYSNPLGCTLEICKGTLKTRKMYSHFLPLYVASNYAAKSALEAQLMTRKAYESNFKSTGQITVLTKR
ncbi:hypothetical protein T4B_2208 [Trichinella pseudospiralis]|uniref:Uncharacterized protein n=1 Tax=Trichinella pseudospiralis TaxID=6337 RepID=A0A0V1JRB2_TRIPS|nr:hypothetical protein T4A_42 [Trichinella pseudospiralis]KRZ22821.1 hypothetical protein T4B_2208 [Trichinella pseudospiralis]KRZ37520.1 hypothetical protein T4C_4073 [Trichinella pseudospiralis]